MYINTYLFEIYLYMIYKNFVPNNLNMEKPNAEGNFFHQPIHSAKRQQLQPLTRKSAITLGGYNQSIKPSVIESMLSKKAAVSMSYYNSIAIQSFK